MKVTIKDVAKEAGVSIGTVSRVLNGKDRVSQATRTKIKEAIERLNFKPDQTARAMISKQTKSIGLVVPSLRNEYWSALAEHVQEAAWDQGYTLLLCTAGIKLDKHLACIHTLIERKVDGIIAGIRVYEPEERQQLSLIRFPDEVSLVSLVQELPDRMFIGVDQFHSSIHAVNHLIKLGHRRIAYIGPSSERELGYRSALQNHGIPIDEELILQGDGSFRSGYHLVMQLQERDAAYSALFCWNDMSALGAMQALQSIGVRIPEDVAVVGYDDVPFAQLAKPALTTVNQPLREIGKAAVHHLLELIQGSVSPAQAAQRNILFEAKLMIRESCGAALRSEA